MILLLLLFVGISVAICNHKDRDIYKQKGHTFETKFRSFGGLFVSQSNYEGKVAKEMGLSKPCSRCYGDAYTCGYNNCKSSCWRESPACTTCLKDSGCTDKCNQCTGFVI